MKLIRSASNIDGDAGLRSFINYALSKGLKVGWDHKDYFGRVNIGPLGDLDFNSASNNPQMYFSINTDGKLHTYKIDYQMANGFLDAVIELRKFADN